LKIDLVIHPEELAAQEIVRLVKRTAGNEIIDIADGQTQVMATRVNDASPLAQPEIEDPFHEPTTHFHSGSWALPEGSPPSYPAAITKFCLRIRY
jgi:hypothetical protein